MTKTNKKLSYLLITLLLIIVAIVGKNSIISEGKNYNDKAVEKNKVSIFLDDELIEFANKAIIKQNKIYAPIDELSKAIGLESEVKKDNKVIIKKQEKTLLIDIKEKTAVTEKDDIIPIDSIENKNQLLVPIDIIVKHFGYNISALHNDTIKISSNSNKVGNIEGETDKEGEIDKQENKNTVSGQDMNLAPSDKNDNPSANVKVAYLTFDDGPNINTPKILDVLKEKDVKATFFMLGSSIISHRDITKRISDEEHGLGVHSMTHNFKSVYAHPQSFLNEMNGANDVLFEATGKGTLLLRAPYGSKPYMKEEYRDLTSSWGYRVWDWNVDSKDSLRKNTTADQVYQEVVNQVADKNQAVILFHDKEHTLEALPKIIEYLTLNGFEIKKIDQEMTPINFWNDIR